jgi:aryl-alcohol dehydrogenase-like predicted oxidoreductase
VYHSTAGDPRDVGLAPERISRQLESSLARLGVDRVDLYLAHEPDPHVPVRDTIACFESVRAQGMIGAWGLSNYSHAELREALEHGRPALVQNSFSLLDRGDEADVLPLCAEEGIPYVPFGPLAGGWLTGKYRRGVHFPAGSRMTQRPGPYERYVDEAVFDGLEALEREAAGHDVDSATLAFAWVLARCDGAVCGPNRAAHLDPVLAARALALSQDDVDRIGGLFG